MNNPALQFLLRGGQLNEYNLAGASDDLKHILNETLAHGAFRIEGKDERDVMPRRLAERRQPDFFAQQYERLLPKGKSEPTKSTVR